MLRGGWIVVWKDCFSGALGDTDAAIYALVGIDDEHVLALVEAIDGTDLYAIRVLTLDAIFGDDIGHLILPPRMGRRVCAQTGPLKMPIRYIFC
ncbi:protein of unknown function [Candidatus Filomicrobium marinum]|uniref:Uncharacterized protein n=1 Tax=Candidatus Filomicrobium marinum TaxID=1608628 RepID=A0A0D6JFC3_9HYPH|nr:protein of unknown function [Candidatus Filomicrobium marinum]CPR19335.1 protein of unknown function [Candidatus Filomicrobium marinum]